MPSKVSPSNNLCGLRDSTGCSHLANVAGVMTRGITDCGVAIGAAAALALAAWRVSHGLMSIEALLIVLMAGTEVFRPTEYARGRALLSRAQDLERREDRRHPTRNALMESRNGRLA